MRRVSYKSVLSKASALYLGNPTPNDKAATALNVHINKRAAECWESFFWPEWTGTEARTFRDVWNSSDTYAAGTERYYRPADKYAVSLVSNTNHAPYTYSNGTWTINSAWWGESASAYTAPDYVSTATYVRGEKVYYPDTQKFYALYAATSTGNAPTDATKWGELIRLKRNLDVDQSWAATVIGEFKNLWSDNRELNPEACEVPFILGTNGAAIVREDYNQVYAEFRLRVPSWTGDAYVSGGATVASGTQVYDNTLGDYYTALSTTNAAVTDTTKFTRIDFPYVLRDAVAQLAYADMLRGDGMNEKSALEVAEGFRCLRREFDKIERQQKQHTPLNVRTR